VATPPGLSALIYNTAATNLTVTFFGRPTPVLNRPNFTIVGLPDTQFYTASVHGGTPEIFTGQTEWIITNRVSHNIVYVADYGDCVDNGEVESQWLNVTNSLYRLEDPLRTLLDYGIPYGISPGNHDNFYPYPDDFRFYNKYFPVARFAGKPYYAGHYGTNNNDHYSFITTGGLNLMLLFLEFDAGQKTNVMAWANSVLAENRDRRAIVVSHSLLDGNTAEFNAQGLPIYEALKANTNIFLMLSGHHPEAQSRSNTFNGNTIRTLSSDYTSYTNGGQGYMRLMEFSPSNNTLRVQTYSPFLNEFNTKPRSDFLLTGIDLSPLNDGFTPIQTLNNIQPGIVSSSPWTGLFAGTNYDWYVTVSDGTTTTQSTRCTFRSSLDSPVGETPAPGVPYIFRTVRQGDGNITLLWRAVGGARYRVEFKNDGAGGFAEIVRPQSEETDPSPPGISSVQGFTDDFSLTGGVPPGGMRFYRVKRIESAP